MIAIRLAAMHLTNDICVVCFVKLARTVDVHESDGLEHVGPIR